MFDVIPCIHECFALFFRLDLDILTLLKDFMALTEDKDEDETLDDINTYKSLKSRKRFQSLDATRTLGTIVVGKRKK